jgi:hypothetical protein
MSLKERVHTCNSYPKYTRLNKIKRALKCNANSEVFILIRASCNVSSQEFLLQLSVDITVGIIILYINLLENNNKRIEFNYY